MGSHVQEEVCARSEAAEGFEGKMMGRKKRRNTEWDGPCMRCGTWNVCAQRHFLNDEVDNDVIQVVGVSSDSDVVRCFLSLGSLALVDLFFVVRSGSILNAHRF